LIYTRPYITSRFIAYEGDSRAHQLSLAVMVLDSFTGEPPRIAIRVRLTQLQLVPARFKTLPPSVPVRTQGGFFCFEGIEDGDYALLVEPERTTSDWYYLESGGSIDSTFERDINLPLPDPLSPVEIATFVPKPSYPFPANATLVRGKVTQGTAAGVEGAIVSTTYQHEDPPGAPPSQTAVRTLTDREGEFVLFFKRLPSATQMIMVMADKDVAHGQEPVIITEGTTRKGVQLDLT